MAQRIRPRWRPLYFIEKLSTKYGFLGELVRILFQPFIPYETRPGEPFRELPVEAGDIADEQLAFCQAIFDESETRQTHIEKKAQWTFTAMAFLLPTFVSFSVFLIRHPGFKFDDYRLSFVFLIPSIVFLFCSFISALRAIAIRQRQILFVHAVISEKDGTFLKYQKKLHAQGLLYCAIINTEIDGHTAHFVKGAHWYLAMAVISFGLGMIIAGTQIVGGAAKVDNLQITPAPFMGAVFVFDFPLG